jgi:hypothetical protein
MPDWNAPPLAISTSYANRPAFGQKGRWWQQTDGPFSAYDDGTQWVEFAYGQRVFPQALPTTWRNQDSATADTTHGGLILDHINVDSSESLIIRETGISGNYTHTIAMIPLVTPKPIATNGFTWWCGLALIESGTGKVVTFVLNNHHDTTTLTLAVDGWNSVTSYNTNYTKKNAYLLSPLLWLQISDNGTTVTYSIGQTRDDLLEFFSHAHGTGFTSAPDKIGVVMDKAATGSLSPELHTNVWFTSWE